MPLNDTFCRTLTGTVASLSNNASAICQVCLLNGCTWCKRTSNPFCWSGRPSDLTNSNDPNRNACTTDHSTSTDGNMKHDAIVQKCVVDSGMTAATVVALIIWALIIVCCVGSCCFTVWYLAYQRGKRSQTVHVDDWNSNAQGNAHGGHYVAGVTAVPLQYPVQPHHSQYAPVPVQTGVVLYNGNTGNMESQQQYYYPQQMQPQSQQQQQLQQLQLQQQQQQQQQLGGQVHQISIPAGGEGGHQIKTIPLVVATPI